MRLGGPLRRTGAVFAEYLLDFSDALPQVLFGRTSQPGAPVRVWELLLPALRIEFQDGLALASAFQNHGLAGDMSFGAGVGPVLGSLHQASLDGVVLHIPHRCSIVLRAQALAAVVVLPGVSVSSSGQVQQAGVAGLEVSHEVGESALPRWFQDQVDVIGHAAEGMDAKGVAPGHEKQAVDVEQVESVVEKHPSAVIASLVDVIDLATAPGSERSSHCTEVVGVDQKFSHLSLRFSFR